MERDPTGPPPIARLRQPEIDELLNRVVPAHLASIDPSGFPRVTPIWFLWKDGAFYMTSFRNKPHLRNLRHDPKASVCVDVEHVAADGQRPNQQVKGSGEVQLYPDEGGRVTREITRKYASGPLASAEVERRGRMDRMVIRLAPRSLVGLAGGPPAHLERR